MSALAAAARRVLARFASPMIAATVAASTAAFAGEPMRFTVRALSGTVLVRTAHAPRWAQVRVGDRLPEGGLLQVAAGGAVTLEQAGRGGSESASQLTLSEPVVVRVAATMLRTVKVNPLFIQRGVALATRPPASPAGRITRVLRSAWESMTAVATGGGAPPPPASFDALTEQGMALGVSSKRLEVLAPATNALVAPVRLPAEERLDWVRPRSAGRGYLIYAWPTSAARGQPVAATNDEFYTLTFDRPGAYFVQVTSKDGVWQSEARPLHVTAPTLTAAAGAATATVGRGVDLVGALTPLFPPDQFVLAARGDPATLVFSWRAPEVSRAPSYRLTIVARSGKAPIRVPTEATTAEVRLAPGDYTWSVSVVGVAGSSEPRRLVVEAPARAATTSQRLGLIDAAFLGAVATTIYLEDGL